MKRVLFVTWDGPDQNYLHSLFFPIFASMSKYGFRVDVLQFRWGTQQQTAQVSAAAAASSIGYRSVQIRRRPKLVGALASVTHGALTLGHVLRSGEYDLVMPRSILPGQMVNLARSSVPVVFDADGLPADERVEFAGWSAHGWLYRVWRDIEAESVRRASAVITRTTAAKTVLLERAGPQTCAEGVIVAPNGKDETVFSPGEPEQRARSRADCGVPEKAPWLVFAGSIGPQYRPDALLAFYRLVLARAPDTRLTILTGQGAEVRALLSSQGLSSANVTVQRAAPDAVPKYLAAADLGLAFRAASFSQRAVSPIKVAEYLLCGLPVLANSGVGDLERQVPASAGCLLPDTEPESLVRAADWFVREVHQERERYREAARAAGLASFSLPLCAQRYASACSFALERGIAKLRPSG
jgi:glycosyltransferase involved in cell wall biosynthesis